MFSTTADVCVTVRANEDYSSPAGITLDACLILRWPEPDPNFEGKPGTDMVCIFLSFLQ